MTKPSRSTAKSMVSPIFAVIYDCVMGVTRQRGIWSRNVFSLYSIVVLNKVAGILVTDNSEMRLVRKLSYVRIRLWYGYV